MVKDTQERKARILFVSHCSNLYGAETALLSLISGLDKSSYEIVVACPESGPLQEELNKLSIRWISLPTTSWMMGRFRTIRSVLRFPKQFINVFRAILVLKKSKFDLVHCNSSVCLEAALAAKVLGIPVIMHCRELLKDSPYGFFLGWKRAFRLISGLADRMICVSKTVEGEIHQAHCGLEKTIVVYDTFTVPHTSLVDDIGAVSSPKKSGSGPVIGCVAGIHPRKGIPILLHAFSIVERSFPKASLMIVGHGKAAYIKKLKAIASKLGIASSVKFVGQVAHAGDFYKRFTLLAVPSYAEAFGLVYGEAALFALPAIGTSSGAAKEIIQDGVTGFIVSPGNAEELAKTILRILENPQLAEEMGRRAKEHVEKQFTLKNLVEGVERVYQDLLD